MHEERMDASHLFFLPSVVSYDGVQLCQGCASTSAETEQGVGYWNEVGGSIGIK